MKRNGKVAYSYIRFSSPQQAKGDSFRRQIEGSRRLCEKHKWTLDESLSLYDRGVSAFKGKNALQGKLGAFIKACDEGLVKIGSVLIVENLDRLSRQEVPDALELFLGILRRKITIATLDPEELFTRENLSEIQLIIVIVILSRAYDESRTKSVRSKANWSEKRKNLDKKKLTGAGPSWLKLSKDRTKWELIPQKAAVVRRIFDLTIKGKASRDITKLFNTEGVPTLKYAKTWNPSSIQQTLRSRCVLGEYQPCVGSGSGRKPVGDPIPDYYPAIIDEGIFYKAQQIVSQRFIQRGPRGKEVGNLFTGLLYDAKTKEKMYIHGYGTKKDKGKAHGKTLVSKAANEGRAEWIAFPYWTFEETFLHFAEELRIEDLIPQTGETTALKKNISHIEGQLSKVEVKIRELQKEIEGEGELKALLPVLRNLEKKQETLTQRLDELRTELHSSLDINIASTVEIIKELRKPDSDHTELRQRLKTQIGSLVSEIWMYVSKGTGAKTARCQVFFRHSDAVRYFQLTKKHKIPRPINSFSVKGDWSSVDFRKLTKAQMKYMDEAVR